MKIKYLIKNLEKLDKEISSIARQTKDTHKGLWKSLFPYTLEETIKVLRRVEDHCQCVSCKDGYLHHSDCAVHVEEGETVGECNGGCDKLNNK